MTDEWVLDMSKLKGLEKYVEDIEFQSKWNAIKLQNKRRLAEWIHHNCKITVNENSLFDMQVKRIHEYKRQLMNVLYIIYRYLTIKDMSPEDRKNVVPRTSMFSGKAAPAYVNAKLIIKLINEVSCVINNDEQVNSLFKVIFLPNYNVSNA
jgi:starch phosphorylase